MAGISKPINSLIEDTDLQMRALAFLVTSAATFVLLCSLWPLTVSGFRSTAALVVDGAVSKTDDEMEAELKTAVLAETNDDGLASIIDEIEQLGNLNSKQIEYRDYQTIRESIRIGHFNDSGGQRFEVAFEGDGGKDERQLVDVLVQRIAKRMNVGDSPLESNAPMMERFAQAEWIVDQMEGDLNYVKKSLSSLDGTPSTELSLEESSELESQGSSNFQFASSKRVVSPTTDDLKGSIESIDVENLRTILDGLKEDAATQSLQPKVKPGNFQLPKPTKTLPINGVPSVPFLLLLGGFAGLMGTVVAWNFDPFVSRGFSNTASVRRKLNVPVVATLDLKNTETESEDSTRPLANRVVDYAGLFLLGVLIVILGFVMINAEVREAFFENPFFGCAKIIRIFTGH